MSTVNSTNNKKGWLVTIVGTCALLALGVLYAWSVFIANIPADWGWSDSQKTLPYSIACVVFSIMTMVGVRLMGKHRPPIVISIGGILAGVGVILSGLSPPIWVLTFGVLLFPPIQFGRGQVGNSCRVNQNSPIHKFN
jgi:OFA family oxalate/formate antiporter-like MFS transporter